MWRVQRTFPASSRCNVYKIAMKCQHNVNHKFTSKEKRKKSHLSKHTGCSSNLVITIKRYVKNSKAINLKSSDPSLLDWPCFISLKFTHNHPLTSAAVLRFRPLCNQVKEKIVFLFKKGHSAASALESIKLELFLENGDKYYDLAEDRFYIPTLSQVQYIFNQTFGANCGENDNSRPHLENLVDVYNANNETGRVEIGRFGHSRFVALCSPIMARAHALLPHSSQMVVLEVSAKHDKNGCNIYLFTSPTPVGSIPLGCIVSDSDDPDILSDALITLKRCFPSDSFYSQGDPYILVSNDNSNRQDPLKSHFPKSIVLLCQSHVMKNVWDWINNNNNIPRTMREEVYYDIKNLVFCRNAKELIALYNLLLSKYDASLPKLINFLKSMWTNHSTWSSAFRSNVNGNTYLQNYIEITFKTLKECLFERFKQFNLTQIVDFMLVFYESFICKRMIEFCEGKVCKRLLYKYVHPTSVVNPSTIVQTEGDFDCYYVPSESDYNTKHMVDVKLGFCSCDQGRASRLCKHLCGVVNILESPDHFTNAPQHFKTMLYKIALGRACMDVPDPLKILTEPSTNTCLVNNSHEPSPPTEMKLSQDEYIQLNSFFNAINEGIVSKSDLFVPAVKEMLHQYSNINSDVKFIKALKMFGQYSKNKSYLSNSSKNNHNKVKIIPRKYSTQFFLNKHKIHAKKIKNLHQNINIAKNSEPVT